MDEQQQDANTALLELDKGLRAQKVGQQCEAIVRFPGLFERFPFPILINSGFLKLADVFRDGNNFLRLCILRVAQQSRHHLDKILNVAELRKRISVVIHSNDPYARAITLRMFGSIASIISDEKSVHHSIRQGLDSHDLVEQEAAVYATIQFSSHSEEFAKSICNKIAAMLQGLSTPLEVKLKLIPILQNMYHDIQVSSKSHEVLKELLPIYPAEEFVVTTLNTLTTLSMRSLVDIPSQIAVLLQHLRCDPREAIKRVTLQNLNMLADATPHLWTLSDASELIKVYSLPALQPSLKGAILDVLCTLMTGDTTSHLIDDGNNMVELCRKCYCDKDLHQAACATKLFVLVATSIVKNNQSVSASKDGLLQECADAMESLLMVLAPECEYSNEDLASLKILLPALLRLCKTATPDIVNNLFKVVFDLVEDCQLNSKVTSRLLEILISIGINRKEDLLSPFSNVLMNLLDIIGSESSEYQDDVVYQQVVTHICTLLFISNRRIQNRELGEIITRQITSDDFAANKWTWYRIARQASRIGEHKVASGLFRLLSYNVVSERYYFWLKSLHEFETAESLLLHGNCDRVDQKVLFEASQHYQEGLTSLNAAVSPEHQLSFQLKFAKLRSSVFVAHSHLLMVCKQMHLSPPPTVETSQGSPSTSTHYSTSPHGHLKMQLKECGNNFVSIADKYGKLHLTSFDADHSSLQCIDMLQYSCSVIAQAIDLIINLPGQEASSLRRGNFCDQDFMMKDDSQLNFALSKAIKSIVSELNRVVSLSSQGINNTHIDCLKKCSAQLLAVPLSFPRYFYQSLQTTTIKLAMSPSQRSPNEPITLDISTLLALKIEGVIRQGCTVGGFKESESYLMKGRNLYDESSTAGSKLKTFRRISEVTVLVKSSHSTVGKAHNHNVKSPDNGGVHLEQTVKPHNDYFQVQFLLSLPVVGTHNLIIECSLIDEKGARWKCGPTESLTVKCSDDAARIKAAMHASHQASAR